MDMYQQPLRPSDLSTQHKNRSVRTIIGVMIIAALLFFGWQYYQKHPFSLNKDTGLSAEKRAVLEAVIAGGGTQDSAILEKTMVGDKKLTDEQKVKVLQSLMASQQK